MKKITGHRHMCVNIRGMLNYFRRKSMAGLIVDKGRELSDEEARNYLYDHIEKGQQQTEEDAHGEIPLAPPEEPFQQRPAASSPPAFFLSRLRFPFVHTTLTFSRFSLSAR